MNLGQLCWLKFPACYERGKDAREHDKNLSHLLIVSFK